MNIRQKKYNPTTQTFSNDPGNAFTVERHMPVPYNLQYNVDIWTSNTEQKLQLLEQILEDTFYLSKRMGRKDKDKKLLFV